MILYHLINFWTLSHGGNCSQFDYSLVSTRLYGGRVWAKN